MNQLVLSVPKISCGNCVAAVREEVGLVAGVNAVEVDLATRTVRVDGDADPAAVRAAIAEAGHQVA
ncbi:heavy-metal-associated domain-containing protein [Micromonospora yasonensis]|uniref:heavy-metal-associated domain-containing protein n=1 Tax=Micromonospora yasonensis TaxID=1128667 RepID=UPI00222EB135|nr:heavy-metal-associated domain-containing protein [Micromonospora yasonensis]MCW3843483.1 heavy-metal-associated domain-containing protein [Micromonospora yasonensis]